MRRAPPGKPHHSLPCAHSVSDPEALDNSVATVMTDVFQKNEINLSRKFSKIVRIFDKIDDSKNRRVINGPQSFWDFILELFKND